MLDGLMCFDKPKLLEKRISLLQALDECGSITRAAKNAGLSYKATWEMINTMNNLSTSPLVDRVIGGIGGGGTTLTQYGKDFIKNYSVLKEEYERFLKVIADASMFQTEHIKNLQRMTMRISARNQLMGKVGEIIQGKVNSSISIVLKSGVILTSTITNSAIEDLGIDIGYTVIAIMKASSVLIAPNSNISISARNKLIGNVTDIKFGEVNAQISIDIGQNDIIVSTITCESAKSLQLYVGLSVCAIIKSSDILIGK